MARSLLFPILFLGANLFAQESKTQLGVAHIGGLYSFSETDYLNEGAEAAMEMGARCIKVGLSLDTGNPSPKLYPFHSEWPSVNTLEALAATPYFKTLFAKDFDTFILNTFRPGRPAAYWRDGISKKDARVEEEMFAALTRYLLTTYSRTNKTFILQNWEGDWAIRGSYDPLQIPSEEAVSGMKA